MRRLRTVARSAVAVAVTSLMLACTVAVAAEPVALEGTYWRLVRLHGEAVRIAEGTSLPHIALHGDTDRVAGFGGCNRFFGQYSTSGQEISIQPLGGTRASCPGTDALERSFIGALAAIDHYVLDGGQLSLSGGGQQILVLEAVVD
ncbi:MAG: META domain-containing protein [Gammaproteobacteria bacterium]|jgi:heat shock protein HslJ